MNEKFKEANRRENALIARARDYLASAKLEDFSKADFEKLLLQRRLVSFQFTPIYDEAICFLDNKSARNAIKWLRNEEYPRNEPSHREELIRDLNTLGIDNGRIASEKVSPDTCRSISGLYELVRPRIHESARNYDLRCLAGLRMAEEILVSEEYRLLIDEMARRYELKPEHLNFYNTHFEHDAKKVPLGTRGKSHSDVLGMIIAKSLSDESSLRIFTKAQEEAYKARIVDFYKQFR